MLIAIPSKGRAGRTTTNRLLIGEGIFYVPESEAHQYEEFVEDVVAVPVTVQGITATRNWILKSTDEREVVFVDDDLKRAGYVQVGDRNMKCIDIDDEAFWLAEFQKAFDLCDGMGYKIWGMRTESSSRGMYPYNPILFRTYITASCMGIVNDGEYYFDETFPVKEDYEIMLRHLRDKGGVVGIRYLHWQNSHWGDEGGCKNYRTVEMERDAIKRLVEMYPGMISSITRRASEFTVHLTL